MSSIDSMPRAVQWMFKKTIAALLLFAIVAVARRASAHDEPCTVVDGKDPCGPGEICTEQSGALGTCVPIPCSTDADCSAASPRTLCDLVASPSECVECRTDADCGGSKRCEKDPRTGRRGLCAECLLGDADGCATSPAGARCQIITGTCGCDTSADCTPPLTCSATNVCVERDAGAPAPTPSSAPALADAGVSNVVSSEPEPPVSQLARAKGCSAGASAHASSTVDLGSSLVAIVVARRRRRFSRGAGRPTACRS